MNRTDGHLRSSLRLLLDQLDRLLAEAESLLQQLEEAAHEDAHQDHSLDSWRWN